MEKPLGIYIREGQKMKRNKTDKKLKKNQKQKNSQEQMIPPIPKKNLAERLGISSELLLGEPKITVTGDFLVEIVNHKGIVSFSDTQIEVNTRKYVYKIQGSSLIITSLTDEEVSVSGNVVNIEKI